MEFTRLGEALLEGFSFFANSTLQWLLVNRRLEFYVFVTKIFVLNVLLIYFFYFQLLDHNNLDKTHLFQIQ